MKAQEFLRKGADLLEERGKQYDQPGGERSMGKCVAAFNAITGRDLSESEGWLLLQVLKDVRQWQNPGRFHADSAEDCISYAALKAEALVSDANKASDYMGFPALDKYGAHIEPASLIDDESPRAQAIGQNGNDGLHYPEDIQAGDLVEYIKSSNDEFTRGKTYLVELVDDSNAPFDVIDDSGEENCLARRECRFHSRPTKDT